MRLFAVALPMTMLTQAEQDTVQVCGQQFAFSCRLRCIKKTGVDPVIMNEEEWTAVQGCDTIQDFMDLFTEEHLEFFFEEQVVQIEGGDGTMHSGHVCADNSQNVQMDLTKARGSHHRHAADFKQRLITVQNKSLKGNNSEDVKKQCASGTSAMSKRMATVARPGHRRAQTTTVEDEHMVSDDEELENDLNDDAVVHIQVHVDAL